MTKLQTILVPTDFSPQAAAALEFAVALAQRANAALHLVHVDDFVSYALPVPGIAVAGGVLADLRAGLNERLTALRSEVLTAGVRQAEATLLEGRPYMEIVRLAEALPADLIVMGTHGRGGFSHLMLGSVAERVARAAPCPVIAVPHKLRADSAAA
jgi:universal stress protein A